ncbi:MAG: BRO family protein, partial [Bilophila wadsworthia]
MTASLCFNEFTFSPVIRDSQPWFKSSELARALGYKDENSVRRIYERNADEFTENMTQVVENLHTVNLTVRARIFSLRGCYALAMFARTPVAKAFRKWCLDVIEQYGDRVPVECPTPLAPSTPDDRKP